MSTLNNLRATFNAKIVAIAAAIDASLTVQTEPDVPWSDPGVRVAWLEGELPRGVNRYARNVRVHLHGEIDTYTADTYMDAIVQGLGLPAVQSGIATLPLLDYSQNPPTSIGTIEIERSPRGITALPPPDEAPSHRHYAITLVLIYRKG